MLRLRLLEIWLIDRLFRNKPSIDWLFSLHLPDFLRTNEAKTSRRIETAHLPGRYGVSSQG